MPHITLHAIVSGRVQGVYFREYTRQVAEKNGVRGWVRNNNNGTVEALFTGPKERIEHIKKWLQHGSPLSSVQNVDCSYSKEVIKFPNFQINY